MDKNHYTCDLSFDGVRKDFKYFVWIERQINWRDAQAQIKTLFKWIEVEDASKRAVAKRGTASEVIRSTF